MGKVFSSIFVALFCLRAQPAMAYIDPASGSAIMSAIISFFVAIAFTVKTYWYKIKSMFLGRKGNQVSKTDHVQESDK